MPNPSGKTMLTGEADYLQTMMGKERAPGPLGAAPAQPKSTKRKVVSKAKKKKGKRPPPANAMYGE